MWFRFLIEEWNPQNDTWRTTTFLPDHSEVIYGDWSLVEGSFTVQSSKNWVYFVTKGKDNSKAQLFADDLLVKEMTKKAKSLPPRESLRTWGTGN